MGEASLIIDILKHITHNLHNPPLQAKIFTGPGPAA